MADKINYYNFTTPIGRLISGSPSKYRTTGGNNEPLIYKSGENKGQPKREYSLGVAYDKNQADVPAFIRMLKEAAKAEWDKLFDSDLNCLLPSFAGKIIDGDSAIPNKKGHRPCDNEFWPGHWIVWFNSDKEPPCVLPRATERIPASEIKTGYYVRIKGSTRKNDGDTPGMYMNLEGVERSGFGAEISGRPDPIESFRDEAAVAVPAGMSQVPVASGDVGIPHKHQSIPEASGKSTGAATNIPAPPPLQDPGEVMVLYKGNTYKASELLASNWSQAQVDSLPRV